jgi:hypothetical protein
LEDGMTAHRQGEITKRAHAIWESEGRPEGKAAEHWQRAEAEVAAESTPRASRAEASPRAAAAPKSPTAKAKRAQRK